MDPERQWISRLEPETPEEPAVDLLDESPLGRVSRVFAGGAAAVAGTLGLIAFLDEDLASLRPIAVGVTGLAALVALISDWRSQR